MIALLIGCLASLSLGVDSSSKVPVSGDAECYRAMCDSIQCDSLIKAVAGYADKRLPIRVLDTVRCFNVPFVLIPQLREYYPDSGISCGGGRQSPTACVVHVDSGLVSSLSTDKSRHVLVSFCQIDSSSALWKTIVAFVFINPHGIEDFDEMVIRARMMICFAVFDRKNRLHAFISSEPQQ